MLSRTNAALALARVRTTSLIIALLIFIPSAKAQQGDISRTHDPSIIKCGDTFYIFSTGAGIRVRTSKNLYDWKLIDPVFQAIPQWTMQIQPRGNSLWAPDISFFNGEYHLYYAVSTFGKRRSCIGLATNKTLDPTSGDFHWVDRGKVIETHDTDNWNAIDPAVFVDQQANAWMVLGSCWSGIKLVQLDPSTGLPLDPKIEPKAIVHRPNGKLLEEGYMSQRGGYYYLWASYDHCCRGKDSDYQIVVGRSKNPQGPFLDQDAKPMLEGGGTTVLQSTGAMRGPGSCAVLNEGGKDYLIHHYYDADQNGISKLQIRPLAWSADGWPIAGDPITSPPIDPH